MRFALKGKVTIACGPPPLSAGPTSLYTGASFSRKRRTLSFIAPNFMLWIAFAVLTGGVIWALLVPMQPKGARRGRAKGETEDVTLYRDQLAEVARDVERGVIGEAEAESARIEVSRRLLAAADAAQTAETVPVKSSSRVIGLAIILCVPILSLGIYLAIGSPELPDEPFAPRIAGAASDLSLDALVLKVEQHLKQQPGDVSGWEVLAPAYIRQRNFQAAVTAWSRAIALGGETAARLAARGEAEVFAADGSLTAGAREDFAQAVKLEPSEPRAQYYLGLADIEDGHKDKAIARWKVLLASAPKDAPWRASIENELAALENPGPSAADAKAAGDMTPQARQQMIEGMVSNLASRLEQEPNDLSGWLRLIRAYDVLGKPDAAADALTKARAAFASDPSALKALDVAAKAPLPQ